MREGTNTNLTTLWFDPTGTGTHLQNPLKIGDISDASKELELHILLMTHVMPLLNNTNLI
jgi:hypothetical protein